MASLRVISLVIVGLLGIGVYSSLFTVDQTQQALVIQFGEPKRTIQ